MPRTDYNAYSMASREEPAMKECEEIVVPEVEESVITSTEIIKEALAVESPSEPQFAIVVDCTKLNIRARPGTNMDVVCAVDAGTQLMVDPSDSTNRWCHVYTPAGIDGYCMTAYLSFE